MPKHLAVVPHLTDEELCARAESATDPNDRIRWIAIRHKQLGKPAELIAEICNRKSDWVRRTVRNYNKHGPDVDFDKRKQNGKDTYLTEDIKKQLVDALTHEEPPGGGVWTGPQTALWFKRKIGIEIHKSVGWKYLRMAGWSPQVPRPQHPDSDEEAKDAFKKGSFKKRSPRLGSNIKRQK